MALEDTIKRLQAQQGAGKSEDDAISSAVAQVRSRSKEMSQSTQKPQEDASALAGARYGFAKEQGMAGDLMDYVESISPKFGDMARTAVANLASGIPGVEVSDFKSTTQKYGKDFYQLDDQGRRDRIISTRLSLANDIAHYYGYTPGSSPKAEMAGEFGAEVVDPSSLAPAGRGILGAMKAGGVVGGASAAAEGLAEEGEVDAYDVAIGASVGAATAGAVEAAIIKPIKAYVGRKKDQGIEVNPDELKAELDQQGFDTSKVNFNDLSKELNYKFGTEEVTPELNATIKQTKDGLGIKYEGLGIVDFEKRMGMVDSLDEMGTPVRMKIGESFKAGSKSKPRQPSFDQQVLERDIRLAREEVAALKKSNAKSDTDFSKQVGEVNLRTKEAELAKLESKYSRDFGTSSVDTGTYTPAKEVDMSSYLSTIQKEIDGYGQLTTKPKKRDRDLFIKSDVLSDTKNIGYKWKRRDSAKITTEPKSKEPGSFTRKKGIKDDPALAYNLFEKQFAEKEEIFQVLKNAVPVDSPLYKDVVNTMLKEPSKKFRGEFDIVPPGSRAYTINGVSGEDVYGAIASKAMPWTSNIAEQMSPSIGSLATVNEPQTQLRKILDGATNWVSGSLSPGDRLYNMKTPAGKVANKLLTKSFNNTQSRIGTTLADYRKFRNSLGVKQASGDELLAMQTLRHTVDNTRVSGKVKQLAEHVSKLQRGALRESMELGIISPDEYVNLVKNADYKGYLSRVYDYDKINTKAGKREFVERISTMTLKGEDALKKATNILESILPEDQVPLLTKQLVSKGTGESKSVFIPPNIAEMLWRNYGVNSTTNFRSKHLDASRILPEEWEQALEPFLVNDMEAILASWSQDVFTRIEYARQFGAKDELATKLYDDIGAESTQRAKDFYESYFTALGDLKSETVKTFVNKPEMVKRYVPRLKALQTFKLGLAQIANLGQAPVNGMYYLLAQDALPLHKAVKIWAKGAGQGLKAQFGDKELAYTADKFGATTQTMLLDAMGGINESMHTVFGRKLPGPLELLNNPSTMLRTVGYFNVEKMQRRMGYFMGKGLVEDTVERKARLMAQGNRVNPKKIQQLNKTLEEMGLDPNMNPSEYSLNDMDMAGQYVANTLNFTNDPQTAPRFMQTFWGKFFTQFKSYIVKQTNFINKNIIKPATRGNFAPLMAAAGVGTPAGIGINEFRRMVLADNEEMETWEQVLNAHMALGTLSVFGDVSKQALVSPTSLTAWAAGPSAGDVSRWGYRAATSVAEAWDEDKEVNKKAIFKDFVVKQYNFPLKKQVLESLSKEKKNSVEF